MQRRKQQPIAIRSDRAAARLRALTRNGRSQAAVIEEALDRMPDPDIGPSEAEIEARTAAIVALIGTGLDIPTMEEFDAREYDERGLPR